MVEEYQVKKSNKKIHNEEKSKNFKNPNKLNLNKVLISIKKFICGIPLCQILRHTIKTILICFCFLVIICFLFLIARTKSSLSDVFTTGRVSILKNRPANITRDIIIDMSPFAGPCSIVNLSSALISDIAEKRPNWRLLVLIPKEAKNLYNYKSPNVKLMEITRFRFTFFLMERLFEVKSFGIFHDRLIQLLYYDRIFCDRECDLVWDPIGCIGYCNFMNIPRISTIHDIAYFDTHPPFLEINNFLLISKICMRKAIDFSKKIITVSEFSRNRICDKFCVARDFVKSIPINLSTRLYFDNNPEKTLKTMNRYNLKPQKYFIFCSGWWPNKNHGNLIKAFNKFTQKNSDIKLILVGDHHGVYQSRPIEEFSSDRVIITGFVPDEELGILLKNALAFIHPSVYEGFGMPIIEAMANGIPVACSNVASLPEVAGSAALFFNPFDVGSITRVMHRLADNPQLRKNLIKKGYEQAKKYSDRDAMVDEYIRVMEEVMLENDLKKSRKRTS
ncbi:MAG: glycosyltransferase family 4 protein [Alphaproteobacteria bacterium]|nr:glycosyltransferase family 4 protein [Alphaproteobacteria bacterium]